MLHLVVRKTLIGLIVSNRKVTGRIACNLRLFSEGERDEETNNWFPVPLSDST